jgi:hypothetical protein
MCLGIGSGAEERQHIYPSGRPSVGWTFMIDLHGTHIRSISSCELTGITEAVVADGGIDRQYVMADQLPSFREMIGPPSQPY